MAEPQAGSSTSAMRRAVGAMPPVFAEPASVIGVPDPAVLALLFAESPDRVVVCACDGALIYVNRAPFPAPASHYELLPPAARARAREADARVLASGQAERVEDAGLGPDGTPRWQLTTIVPLKAGGRVVALLRSSSDITERKHEEDRLRRYEAMMVDTQGVAHYGVWEWDITQPHAVWSPGLYAIYDLDPQRYVPSYEEYLKKVHPDDRQRVADATNRVFNEHVPYSHDERIFRPDGSIRYLHTWAVPILDEHGKLLRLMGVCQDITDRAQAEHALAEHARDLARSNAELEQFAYVASHDLQEPLRTVASYVQLLERRYKDRLGTDADELIHYAVDGVRRMKALITGLLEYARVRAQPPQPASLELALDQARLALQPLIEESGARLRHEPLPDVRAEPVQLASLFQNLVANAIRFRGERPPQIDIGAQARDGMIEVVVRDQGIGIEPAYHERIFDIFERLDPDTPGTGIGLAICRKIVERHGGRIWVVSAPGQGAAFHFTLPVSTAAAPSP